MGMRARHTQLTMVWLIVVAARLGAAAAAEASESEKDLVVPGCSSACGNITIPYPFGIGKSSETDKNCFLDESFNLTCNNSIPYTGNVRVLNISSEGQLDMSFFVSKVCYNYSTKTKGHVNIPSLRTPAFTISSNQNKFISVGCDTYGFLNNFRNGTKFSTGCITKCDKSPGFVEQLSHGNCSGIGCCQVDIPPAMKNITIQADSLTNFTNTSNFNKCSYSFVAKVGSYNFSTTELPLKEYPLVVDWAVGNETCEDAQKSTTTYVCKKNSDCEDTESRNGYRCKCKPGYDGNPYLNGCENINECANAILNNCTSERHCRDTDGSFYCFCPKGSSGDGTIAGGCRQHELFTKVAVGAGAGLMALFAGMSWLYLIYQQRKLMKLKEKFFRQNGGFLLQQQLSVRENSSKAIQIFTAEELKKATKDYDESLIIGRGGYGTVFKGFLADNTIVAIKKSKILDQNQIEQFINEVVVLSQINHRNVVKLVGCCLETEVPLLVYEFANNGTLFDYLHDKSKAASVSWKTRLQIAAEAAGALSYLHSAASIPIIHRDVKTANILLDETYTAKVSDFGASRLVPLDQTELSTLVQGTIGYLDPEYMQTSQLTEKSDVYSFGVVLVELLTGEKALSFERPEERRCLAMHFLSCLKEDRLFDVADASILNGGNKEEVKEVAALAARCLRLRGEERPSMKEVAMELEGIRLMEKHQWVNEDLNIMEETQHLLHERSGIHEHRDSCSHQNTGYDSIRDHVLIAFDDGR